MIYSTRRVVSTCHIAGMEPGYNVPGVRRGEMRDGVIVHVTASRDPLHERLGDLRVHEQVPVAAVGMAPQAAEIADVGGDEVCARVREGRWALHRLPPLGRRAVGHLDGAVGGIV